MGKILPVEAVVGAAMLKNKGWLRGRICFENEVVYTEQYNIEILMTSTNFYSSKQEHIFQVTPQQYFCAQCT